MSARTGLAAVVAATLAVPIACSDTTGPPATPLSPDTVVAGMGSFKPDELSPETLLLDGITGAVLGRSTGVPQGFVVDPVRRELVGRQGNETITPEDDEIVGFGFPDLAVQWRVPVSDLTAELPEGVRIFTPGGLDRGGRWIFLGATATSDMNGVLVLARVTGRQAAFVDGFGNLLLRNTFATVEPPGGPELIVLGGPRRPDEALRLLILDSPTLTVQDSVELRTGLPPRLSNVASARDGRHVFALTLDSLFKVDVMTAEIVDRRRRVRQGVRSVIAVTRDPARLFLTDRGPLLSPGLPGSGFLQVYDAETLGNLGRVSLATDKLDGGRPLFMGLISASQERVYVRAGSGPVILTQGGPFQPPTISVVDVESRSVVDTWVFDENVTGGGIAVF